MTEEDDVRWVRSVVSEADPLTYREEVLEDLTERLRLDVRQRIADEALASSHSVVPDPCYPSSWKRAIGSTRSPWMVAVAAAVAVMVGYTGFAAALPDPAWAVERTGEGLVRLELSPVLGRGPESAGLVEELNAVGVSVEVREQDTWWLWQSGRIISIGWDTGGVVPEAFADRQISFDVDLSDVGIVEHGDNSFLIDPKVFTGTVYINIASAPW